MVERVAAFALAVRVNVRDGQPVRTFRPGNDFSLRGNDHGAAAAMGDHQPDEVLRRAHAQGLHTDVIVADGGRAHRWEKDDVRAGERQAARRLGHNEVVADEQAGGAEIGRREDRERSASLAGASFSPGRTNFVITANLPTIATQEEGGVVNRAIRLREVAAHDQIHAMPRGSRAEPVEHPLHGFGQKLLRKRLVRAHPVEQAGRVFGQNKSVAPGFARALHDAFKFCKVLFHRCERVVRVEPEIDNAPGGLRCSDANGVGRTGLGCEAGHCLRQEE